MNVLVVGGGAREHALVWKLAQSPRCDRLYCAPGNFGTAQLAENLPVAATDIDELLTAARELRIDLTVVGPEDPLALGIVDRFREQGLRIVGPTQAAARIESSKWWAKEIMRETGIPTGRAAKFIEDTAALEYLDRLAATDYPVVVKVDGLAAGKGVVVARDRDEAAGAVEAFMSGQAFGVAARAILIEEFLQGTEVSLLALTDGATVLPLLPACDYKRARDGDSGPNTGGMGVYAPTRLLDAAAARDAVKRIFLPAIKRMARKGAPYSGVLYAGLILTEFGPKVLEFNARFGDPETEVLLPLLRSDLLDAFDALADGRLREVTLAWDGGAAVGVVLASGGYPDQYQTGLPIAGLDTAAPDTLVFHAGTKADATGEPVTSGGRVLTVVGQGTTLAEARARAYAGVERIDFPGAYYRHDIALREM